MPESESESINIAIGSATVSKSDTGSNTARRPLQFGHTMLDIGVDLV